MNKRISNNIRNYNRVVVNKKCLDINNFKKKIKLMVLNFFIFIIFILIAYVNIKYNNNISSLKYINYDDGGDSKRNSDKAYHQMIDIIQLNKNIEKNAEKNYNCNTSFGLFIGSTSEIESTPNCNKLCRASSLNNYYTIKTDNHTLINGSKTTPESYYCIRSNISVMKCNTRTSDVVRSSNGSWACNPKWANIFGGIDGNDILVCGGYLDDNGKSYVNRLPDNEDIEEILTDPYSEKDLKNSDSFRFKCTVGKYTNGPLDYMMNEYIESPINRFYRIRNGCAKYLPSAVKGIVMDTNNIGHCRCIKNIHGFLRNYDNTASFYGTIYVSNRISPTSNENTRFNYKYLYNNYFQPTTEASSVNGKNKKLLAISNSNDRTENNDGKNNNGEEEEGDNYYDLYQSLPSVCSPCINSIDIEKKGIINAPRACLKGNRRYIYDSNYLYNHNVIDIFPCGTLQFGNAGEKACMDGQVLISKNSGSYYTLTILDSLYSKFDDSFG